MVFFDNDDDDAMVVSTLLLDNFVTCNVCNCGDTKIEGILGLLLLLLCVGVGGIQDIIGVVMKATSQRKEVKQ